jgi:lipopolysaccharide export system permease protein
MDDGLRYEGNIGKPEMTVVEFGDYSMWINPADTADVRKRYSTWATSALWQERSLKASAELQNRFSYPLALIAFALLAVPLSRSMPREGVYGQVVLAILVYLMASGLSQVASTWMLKGVTPRWMGTWWVVALMLVLALFLARRDLAHGLRGRGRPA